MKCFEQDKLKTYTFTTQMGGKNEKEVWESFRDMLENEYKVWRAFEIKEVK
tara:strand:+ start:213 stop:365 length:153 start_codon:yes stop_codon:yes gene_type:complete